MHAQEVMLTEEQEARMNQHIKVYFEELGLSEDKKQIFNKITKKYALKMKTLKRIMIVNMLNTEN